MGKNKSTNGVSQTNGKESRKRKLDEMNPMEGLENRLKDSSQFLDKIVGLIPAKQYKDADEDVQLNRFAKHKNQTAPKQQLKESSKKAKRVKTEEQNGENDGKPKIGFLGNLLLTTKQNPDDATALQNKLKETIENLKQKRGSTPKSNKKKQKMEWPTKPIKEDEEDEEEDPESSSEEEEESEEEQENEGDQHDGDINFGTFEFGSGKPVPTYLKNKKKRKLSDEKLLAKIEEEKELLASLAKTQGKEAADEYERKKSTKTALLKLQGEKIKDDPKRLKKTIKAKQKKKEKSVADWAERNKQQKKETADKQQQRENNIREHKMAKKEKTNKDNKKKEATKRLSLIHI
eukprot:TRINITY_DN14071_c0_g1_i1.p1 TRINITY_DN14071_c0_g1~~TRINITY_DN14071_c0_g1_i1.p1  ORF type:complete len:347 (+),score=144.06 TRINITY_DN14071_c0_g1_i1:66-1106(+)